MSEGFCWDSNPNQANEGTINILFVALISKFAIFRLLNRAQQQLSLKKNSRKKCFFCAELWSAKVFSMLIILIDR